MAARTIPTPNGSIDVTLSMKGAAGGNEMLKEATAKARDIAASQGKEIIANSYGVAKVGDDVTITFAIKG